MLKRTITTNALIKRLNRKLADREQVIKKSRGISALQNLGEYYLLSWRTNTVDDYHLDVSRLTEWGREEGCLAEWESVADEEVTA
jgi:hypothetical protein